MKMILLVLSLILILTGCNSDKMNVKVCSYKDNATDAEIDIEAYYISSSEEVQRIIVEMRQIFPKEAVKGMNEEKMVSTLQSMLVSSIGEETAMDIEYNTKKREAYIKINFLTENMEESKLAGFNLKKDRRISSFVSKFKALGYCCKGESR